MSVASVWFLIFAALVAIVYNLCPKRALRQGLLSVVNVGFLIPLVPNWSSWIAFGIALTGSYLLARWARAQPSGWFVFATIALLLAGFAILKHYAFLEWVLPADLWNHPIELVGISYMLFKFIHVFVDAWQGQLAPLNFVTYANYQLSFFTLVAGPIQRYNDFQRFWSKADLAPASSSQALHSWNRILTGLIKIGPVAAGAWYVFEEAGNRFEPLRTQYPLFWFLVYVYAYPVYLYFNFSGYTDIVIGTAQLLGFQLPENFDRPYLARNITDFWNRWHISLTHWIRDYVFMTSYKAAAERFPAWSKYIGMGLLFFALFVAGVWHGSTGGFAVFGALNGLGAATNQAYGELLKKLLGRNGFKRYMANSLIRAVAILVTLSYEAFCFLFFSSGIEKALILMRAAVSGSNWSFLENPSLRSLALKLVLVGIPLVALLLTGLFWKRQAILGWVAAMRARLADSLVFLYSFVLCKAALVTVILLFSWAIAERDPVVVYMRF